MAVPVPTTKEGRYGMAKHAGCEAVILLCSERQLPFPVPVIGLKSYAIDGIRYALCYARTSGMD